MYTEKSWRWKTNTSSKMSLPHPCRHSFWSKKHKKAAKKKQSEHNHTSKLHTENSDYTDLNSNYWEAVQLKITRGTRLKSQQTQEEIKFQSILPMPSGIWHCGQWSSSHGTEKVHISKENLTYFKIPCQLHENKK